MKKILRRKKMNNNNKRISRVKKGRANKKPLRKQVEVGYMTEMIVDE
jgi:hypothetical protein